MSRFLVLYRGGDATGLTLKENETLYKKWGQYMDKLVYRTRFPGHTFVLCRLA